MIYREILNRLNMYSRQIDGWNDIKINEQMDVQIDGQKGI